MTRLKANSLNGKFQRVLNAVEVVRSMVIMLQFCCKGDVNV